MSIWFRQPTLEQLNALSANTLVSHLDMRFIEIGDDFLRGTMPVDARTHQPYGVLHGGASVALAETLASTAAACCVDTARYICLGQEINANHLRAVTSGLVTGTTRPYHIGARSQVWGIEIRDAAGHLSCISRITMATVERRRV
ncbi:MAG: hotdog fold thioesterase [Steroidobacteraceae bacterium]|nr:hotdog fold thioesterase [Steroidobacteraceae bacterium]MCW5571505.1 hotdog fold thioesterase [Steroidobacteraceae bacterium]